jgi:fructose-1,6-bisphosphatase/inositol monophosphatase family enzyme
MRTASGPAEASTVLALLHDTADAVAAALARHDTGGLTGERPGQYRADVVADDAAGAVLRAGGVSVLSEETGFRAGEGDEDGVVVVVDPLDGSTNADRRVPWYATSLCAVDAAGPLAAVVVDLAHGVRFEAVRGGGARRAGVSLAPSGCRRVAHAIVGLSGWPPVHLGWNQYRAFGAAALDLCAVASGVLDGYVDCSIDAHGAWDYLGGLLVCREAGAFVADAYGRELVVIEHDARRTPVAAATTQLLDELLAARSAFP